jgi:hypothetical protein
METESIIRHLDKTKPLAVTWYKKNDWSKWGQTDPDTPPCLLMLHFCLSESDQLHLINLMHHSWAFLLKHNQSRSVLFPSPSISPCLAYPSFSDKHLAVGNTVANIPFIETFIISLGWLDLSLGKQYGFQGYR